MLLPGVQQHSIHPAQLEFLNLSGAGTSPHIAHVPVDISVLGAFGTSDLAGAFRNLVEQEPALRSRYVLEGDSPVAVVEPPVHIRIRSVDISMAPKWLQRTLLRIAFTLLLHRRFDQRKGPLYRACLFKLGPEEHRFVLVFDHIVFDGWSVGVVTRALAEHCARLSKGPGDERRKAHYFAYADAQRVWLSPGQGSESAIAYWKRAMAGVFIPFWVPDEHIRFRRGARASIRTYLLPAETVNGMREIARTARASVWMIMLAAFCVVLYEWTAREDTVVATFHSGRPTAELYETVGCCFDVWPLRVSVTEHLTFLDLVTAVKHKYLEALPHLRLPFKRISKIFYETRAEARALPIFFNYVPDYGATRSVSAASGVSIRGRQLLGPRHFTVRGDTRKLYLEAREDESVVHWRMFYGSEILSYDTVHRLAERLQQVLERATRVPSSTVSSVLHPDQGGSS
jgi:hypothetical protein